MVNSDLAGDGLGMRLGWFGNEARGGLGMRSGIVWKLGQK